MATQRFMNLCGIKKRGILDSMCSEFIKTPYSEIRVNGLAHRANISRSSFYLYFEGKEDVLYCVLYQQREELVTQVIAALKKEFGVFYEGMKHLAENIIEDETGQKYYKIYKHIMEDHECKHIVIKMEKEFYSSCLWKAGGRNCYKVINRSLYPNLEEETLKSAIGIGLLIIIRAAVQCYNMDTGAEKEKVRQSILQQLMILDKGLQA